MIHPATQIRWIHNDIGHGVVATQLIPKGTLTWVRDPLDRTFTPQAFQAFDEAHRRVLETYCYRNSKGHYVLCWDHARYMNHSFRPTCLPTPYGFEIAIRDIQPGEELTNDYGCLNIVEAFRPTDEGSRRKIVRPDDLTRHHPAWDRQLRNAVVHIPHLPQPLRAYLSDELWATCLRIAKGEEAMRSILELAERGPPGL
jgi:hypothetical protein